MDADTAFDIITGVCYCGHDQSWHHPDTGVCWDHEGGPVANCPCDEYIERFTE